MFDHDQNAPTPPASSAFEDLMALIKLAGDPKGFQRNLDALMAATVKANEAKAAAARQEASLAARVAEFDKREAKISEVAAEWTSRLAEVKDREGRLREIQNDITLQGNRFKREILNYVGLAEHFNERLQTLPDWDALAQIALGQPDPHMSGDHQAIRGEASGEIDRVPNAPAYATIRRNRPPRPTRADA